MNDNFENGLFLELYNDLERQFESFLEYVPYLDENKNIISYKLWNLILNIGGHIDSAFKEMARYPKFSKNYDVIKIREKIDESEKKYLARHAPKNYSYSSFFACL